MPERFASPIGHLDLQAWLGELAFIEQRTRELAADGSTVQWRCEDSYDDERNVSFGTKPGCTAGPRPRMMYATMYTS
jgi:hypothetical protein